MLRIPFIRYIRRKIKLFTLIPVFDVNELVGDKVLIKKSFLMAFPFPLFKFLTLTISLCYNIFFLLLFFMSSIVYPKPSDHPQSSYYR